MQVGRILPLLVLILTQTWSTELPTGGSELTSIKQWEQPTNCFFIADRGGRFRNFEADLLHQRKPNGPIETIKGCQIVDGEQCLGAVMKSELNGFGLWYHTVLLESPVIHPRAPQARTSTQIIHWTCGSGRCDYSTQTCAPGTRPPGLVLKAYENPELKGMIEDQENYSKAARLGSGSSEALWFGLGLWIFLALD